MSGFLCFSSIIFCFDDERGDERAIIFLSIRRVNETFADSHRSQKEETDPLKVSQQQAIPSLIFVIFSYTVFYDDNDDVVIAASSK